VIARLCILALAAVCLNAQNPVPGDVNFWSEVKESALGARLAGEVRRQTSPLTDSAVKDYIARLGKKIATQARDGIWTGNSRWWVTAWAVARMKLFALPLDISSCRFL
jgi:predicted Zn-dependent protease